MKKKKNIYITKKNWNNYEYEFNFHFVSGVFSIEKCYMNLENDL